MSVLSHEGSCSWIVMGSSQVFTRWSCTNSWETKEQQLQVSSEEDLTPRNIPDAPLRPKRSIFQKVLKTKPEIDVNAFQRGRCSPSPGFTQSLAVKCCPEAQGKNKAGLQALMELQVYLLISQDLYAARHNGGLGTVDFTEEDDLSVLVHWVKKHLFHFYQLFKIQLQKCI